MTKKNYKSQKNNLTEKKKESPLPKRSFLPEISLSDSRLSVLTRTVFFLFSFWFLGIYNADWLYKLQAYSLFLHSQEFAGDILNQSAGFLIYLSRFLTQFLYYPLLGALLLSLGLSGIEWWISRLFKIPSRCFYLSFIPPGLILLAQTSIGYALYHRFEASVVFSLVLGALFVLLLFTFYRKVKSFSWGVWISLLVSFAFFFLIGVYAFVAVMMVVIERVVNKEKYVLWLVMGVLLVGAFLPFVSVKYVFHESYMSGLIAPLPNPFFKGVFVLALLSQLFFLLYPVLFFLKGLKVSNKVMGINLLLFSLSLFAIFYFSFRDDNFRVELRLQRLMEKCKWDEMIREAEKVEEPNRAIAAYRVIALANTNQLSERLFDFNYQFKPLASAYMNGIQKFYYNYDLYFYASFPNAAYLWSMELWVGMGANVYLLKQMALCAMLNGEKELASRYFNLLKQSLFYKKYAEEQERYNNDPDLLMENPVYKRIKDHMPEDNFISPTHYILPVYYAFFQNSFLKNKERCILASLYAKDMKQFIGDIQEMQNIDSEDELPVCMQEALLIYAMLNNNFAVLQNFRINSKGLREKVAHCVKEYKKYGNNLPKPVEERLRKSYKGSYCYYYFFCKNRLRLSYETND